MIWLQISCDMNSLCNKQRNSKKKKTFKNSAVVTSEVTYNETGRGAQLGEAVCSPYNFLRPLYAYSIIVIRI